MILDRPNCFGRVQIVLVRSKSFCPGPKHFGQVQIRLFCTNFYNLDLSEMILTRPKQIGPDQNNWYSTKMIWMVQNHFGPIEQGISLPINRVSTRLPVYWSIHFTWLIHSFILFHLACTSMDDHSLKNPVCFTNSFIHLRVQQGEIFYSFQFYWLPSFLD
jgi:hypothetical protein